MSQDPTSTLDPALAIRAERWLADDPDPAARAELAGLLQTAQAGDAGAAAEIADAFAGLLRFGTAGLRGRLGAGPNRMNRAVVIRAAAGLARYLLDGADREIPRVAVGFDARHGSAQFARDTVAVLVGAGLEAALLPRPLPTPMLAWLSRRFDAGVMVTASHNPAHDNGYKVYLGGDQGGRLIVPPVDAAIAERMAGVQSAADVPRAPSGWSVITDADLEPYLAAAATVAPPGPHGLRIVATPLHGVGGQVLVEVLRRAGFADVTLVPSQAAPDPDFPTVAFPNPEEPGALDEAVALARELDADLVLALDPDADRCAVAVPDLGHPDAGPGGWRSLTGDELGCLLADFVAPTIVATGGGTLACSIVSSTQLAAIAAVHELGHVRTLTGFKWISRAPHLAFGYEEALGYCVAPDLVRDKDGITAAVLTAHLTAGLRARGSTLTAALDELALRDGLYCTTQESCRVDELAQRDLILDTVRRNPPSTLGSEPVVGLDDLAEGADGAPGTTGLRLRLADGWVIIRPSGTEPKLKAYCEVRLDVRGVASGRVAATRTLGAARLARIRNDLAALLSVERTPG